MRTEAPAEVHSIVVSDEQVDKSLRPCRRIVNYTRIAIHCREVAGRMVW